MPENQRPSVGRIVHYHAADNLPPGCNAAIVTRVWSDTTVNLAVFPNNTGPVFTPTSVTKGEDQRQWHWPEYVQPFAVFDPK